MICKNYVSFIFKDGMLFAAQIWQAQVYRHWTPRSNNNLSLALHWQLGFTLGEKEYGMDDSSNQQQQNKTHPTQTQTLPSIIDSHFSSASNVPSSS
jgi:hypothetical protein